MTGRCGVSPQRWVTEDGAAGRSREETFSPQRGIKDSANRPIGSCRISQMRETCPILRVLWLYLAASCVELPGREQRSLLAGDEPERKGHFESCSLKLVNFESECPVAARPDKLAAEVVAGCLRLNISRGRFVGLSGYVIFPACSLIGDPFECFWRATAI